MEIGASLPSALILKSFYMWSIPSCTQTCSYHSAIVTSNTRIDWGFPPTFCPNWAKERAPQHLQSCYMSSLGAISFTWMHSGSGKCAGWKLEH